MTDLRPPQTWDWSLDNSDFATAFAPLTDEDLRSARAYVPTPAGPGLSAIFLIHCRACDYLVSRCQCHERGES